MGESNTSTPIIIIRGYKSLLSDDKSSYLSLSIESKFDIYVRGFQSYHSTYNRKVNSLNYK